MPNTSFTPFFIADLYDDNRKKSDVPRPLHKALLDKFSGESGSGSGSGLWDFSATQKSVIQASASGDLGSGDSKNQDVPVQNVSASVTGSGESSPETQSPMDEIGSGSGSLAEGKRLIRICH